MKRNQREEEGDKRRGGGGGITIKMRKGENR